MKITINLSKREIDKIMETIETEEAVGWIHSDMPMETIFFKAVEEVKKVRE